MIRITGSPRLDHTDWYGQDPKLNVFMDDRGAHLSTVVCGLLYNPMAILTAISNADGFEIRFDESKHPSLWVSVADYHGWVGRFNAQMTYLLSKVDDGFLSFVRWRAIPCQIKDLLDFNELIDIEEQVDPSFGEQIWRNFRNLMMANFQAGVYRFNLQFFAPRGEALYAVLKSIQGADDYARHDDKG